MELKLDRSIIAGLATAALLTAAGCRCAPMITQVEPARVVALPARLLIPATYVGQQNTGAVEVVNEGGGTATLELAIGLPFTVATPALSLVRGQSETVIVTFAPSAPGPSSRTFHVGELEVQVESEGLGVPECVSPAACVSSAFDFGALACVERVEPDGTLCETSCVRGGCDRGVCVGGFKACDDGDTCTVDGCSETNGCSHVTRTCPAPASACQVARCDSATGCGLELVPDGTLCGPDDCKDISTDICLAGQCVQRTRPATGRCANRWIPGAIPGRAGHAMAFDATRGRTILFGGGNKEAVFGDTWEWDGQRWSLRFPATSPPPRTRHAMAWDAVRQRIVLFGGRDQRDKTLADTWEWDGVTWVQRMTAISPPERSDHAMAYDGARRKMVLMGGLSASAEYADTWEWDGSNWLLRTPPVSPSPKSAHSMAFDAARQRVVLFGSGANDRVQSETWEWDGMTWLQRSPSAAPGVRSHHALVYDVARQRVVLFGGYSLHIGAGDFSYGDSWEWDGTAWTRSAAGGAPHQRGQHALAYDSIRQRIVLFGGFEIGGINIGWFGPTRSDTWELDGAAWRQRANLLRSPPLRTFQAMVNDPVRQRVVLFGGEQTYVETYGDLWEWDGAAWFERVPPNNLVPDLRLWHSMVFDWARQRVVMFGGFGGYLGSNTMPIGAPKLSDLWEWDGTNWTERMPMAGPSARGFHLMAYDLARQQTVLFGGYDDVAWLPETWTWDGTTWRTPTSMQTPPASRGQAMVYDAARQRTLLFGGENSAQTWTWDGTEWLEQLPANSPSARSGHAMAYDSLRQRVMLFGGGLGTTANAETWEWDGVTWLQRFPVHSPPPSSGHSMAYDSARERMVLFQGEDTWLFLE